MSQHSMTRRQALLAMSCSVAGLATLGSGWGRADSRHGPGAVLSADEALKRLLDGNARFVAERRAALPLGAERRAELVGGQQPFAIVVGCSDSRVAPELIFDQGLGDIFDIRVAGNVIDDDIQASVEYAVRHLHTPLVLVLGHEQCGAVMAALELREGRCQEPEDIRKLLRRIEPALAHLPEKRDGARRVTDAVEANVRQSMQELAEGGLRKNTKIVGGIYQLASGRVRLLDVR